MNCPNCAAKLEPRTAKDHYGKRFKVLQCKKCGYLWLSEEELNKISRKESLRLCKKYRRAKGGGINDVVYCPSCLIPLLREYAPAAGAGVMLYTCSRCKHTLYSCKNLINLKRGEAGGERDKQEAQKRPVTEPGALLGIILLALMPLVIYALFFQRPLLNARASQIIYSIRVDPISNNSVLIFWQTSIPTTSTIKYGTDRSYKYTSLRDTNYTKNHTLKISGLEAEREYHFMIFASSKDGTVYRSRDTVFNISTFHRQ